MRTDKPIEKYNLDSQLPSNWQTNSLVSGKSFQEIIESGNSEAILLLIKFRESKIKNTGNPFFGNFEKGINLALDLYIHTNENDLSKIFKTAYSKQRLKLELREWDIQQKQRARDHLKAQLEAKAKERQRQEAYGGTLGSW